ncbi:hypothetical protein VTN31DRAFT_7157 [Thermomyces dupontii]|uniref:uncharacterized protein n=1 Tax=Talaromyces thermophilus TaxID=28565 RepID=UPI003742426F
MAPPPAAHLPLSERLKALAQTLQFAWFVGHVVLLLSVFRYSLSYMFFNYYSRPAMIAYRLGFLMAAFTYGIVVHRQHFVYGKLSGTPLQIVAKLLSDENVRYLALALVWLYSRQVSMALFPFGVYSVFHVATYTRTTLLPTLQPGDPSRSGRQSPLADKLGRFVREYYDYGMELVGSLELAILVRLVLSALTFSRGSWILLSIYSLFFRSRYATSPFVRKAVAHATARIDTVISHQSTPPQLRQAWEGFKGLVRQAYDSTDARRYMPAAASPGKKPQ